MNIKASSSQNSAPNRVIKLRCPVCRQRAAFEALNSQDSTITDQQESLLVGIRRCPDPTCFALIFFVYSNKTHQLTDSYPAETIDFDSTDVPQPVLSALEESIKCHSQHCFVASAIMVRKTLEALCKDRNAVGPTLKKRIEALANKVVLPAELLAGLDDLRLLGNDAAHIESQEYEKVGQEEVEVSIEFTKEVLKAVYQYSALLNKLRALKKKPTGP